MRRRGPFRLFRRIRRVLSQGVSSDLQRAHRLMEAGKFKAAAVLYEGLAQSAEARMGKHSPQLYLQAGRAYMMAGDKEAGLTSVRKGFKLLKDRKDWIQINRFGNKVVTELKNYGLIGEANELEAYLKSDIHPDFDNQADELINEAELPTHCPGCGGPIRPDEVEWLDKKTAECSYCGNPIRGL